MVLDKYSHASTSGKSERQKLTRQTVVATTFADSLHYRVAIAVVALTAVTSPADCRRKDDEPVQCAGAKLTSDRVQIPGSFHLIISPISEVTITDTILCPKQEAQLLLGDRATRKHATDS